MEERVQHTTQENIEIIRYLVRYFTYRKRYEVYGMDEEDLVQECFLYFLERKYFEKYDPSKSTYKTYLSYGVRNRIIDLARKHGREKPHIEISAIGAEYEGGAWEKLLEYKQTPSVEDFVLALEFFNRVKFSLPTECEPKRKTSLRQIFVEFFEKNLTCIEIAQKYGERLHTIYEHLSTIKTVASLI